MNSWRERLWPGWLGFAASVGTLMLGLLEAALLDISPDHRRLLMLTVFLLAGLLLFRRVSPLLVFFGAFTALVVMSSLTGDATAAGALGMTAAAANVGLEVPLPRLVIAPAGLVVVLGTALASGSSDLSAIDVAAILVMYLGSMFVGMAFRGRLHRVAELSERAAALRMEGAVRAREAAEAERARIARELHDIVSHSISVVVVQTQAVRRRLGPEHQAEADDLRSVETVARQAMAEMRRMLGVLRAQPGTASLEPQPGLAQLPRLVERVRAAGLPVDVHTAGLPSALPPGVDLAAYRIIQEALTNTVKHAGPTTATISICYGERELSIEVRDTGRGGTIGIGQGNGLVGMQERVAIYDGTLEYGALNGSGDGFRVAARLPVREAGLGD